MLSELGRRPIIGGKEGSFGDDFETDLGLLLREQRRQDADDREKELNLYRSGSAPPTVEGSLAAVGGLFGTSGGSPFSDLSGNSKYVNGFASEEELRSDPAYHSYYYSNVNLNPRLPPPLLSKEDWRFAQRLKGGSSGLGGIGDRRKVNHSDNGGSRSMFSMPPGFNSRKEEHEANNEKFGASAEWGGDGLIGLSGIGLGSKEKSLAEIFQDDLGRSTPVSRHPSRPASRNTFDENVEILASAENELAHLRREMNSVRGSSVQNIGPPATYSYASVVGGSLSRSTTPDPQLVARAPSPCITPIGEGRAGASEKRGANMPNSFNGISPGVSESTDLTAALSGLNLANNDVMNEANHFPASHFEQENYLIASQGGQMNMKQHPYIKNSKSSHFDMPSNHSAKSSHPDVTDNNRSSIDQGNSSLLADRQANPYRSTHSSANPYLKGSSPFSLSGGGSGLASQYQNEDGMLNYGLSEYSMNPALASMMASQLGTGNLPPLYENVAAAMAVPGMDSRTMGESQNLGRMSASHVVANGIQGPFVDPVYLQYLRTAEYAAAAQLAVLNDPNVDLNYVGQNSYTDVIGQQKAYLGALSSLRGSHYGASSGIKSGGSALRAYYGNPAYGVGMYPGSPLASAVIPNSPVASANSIRHNEFNMRMHSGMRNWHMDAADGNFASSLLEEFKSNKAKNFELSEISGHVVEFSADQYGSRFIQQKLETATLEEKNMVYQEIFPQALSLMTDVFGNYVIQKFFEHGMPSQIRELAIKLYGHVLTLSLQMYGCRVIQKAIEVVDLDQKIKMVEELDGHIMRCVRDQNGNHVIQKCIECVPEESIDFIVSTFFDQFVTLSTYPYGCRVVQRVLEHCRDPRTQEKVMDEILGSVSMLAQDQYGNYVIQHVLEHGKPHERSVIIKELAGKIVQMSQQKFASNVVEKCLTFGDPNERQLLVNEMLGSTDENEPLQAMMKDQFANYVVQKVLETCDDQQRELIMTRIKVHLNALKKYTYGKHIVARVEKLLAAGERRMGVQSPNPAYAT